MQTIVGMVLAVAGGPLILPSPFQQFFPAVLAVAALCVMVALTGCRIPVQSASNPSPPPPAGRIGFLSSQRPEPSYDALAYGLRDLGYIEGENLTMEYRYAEGDPARLPAQAMELVDLRVDAIIAADSLSAKAARQVTSSIPIITTMGGNPLEMGLIESLSRPGGNITGMSSSISGLAGKRLEILTTALPTVRRVGVLRSPDNAFRNTEWTELTEVAELLNLRLSEMPVREADDIDGAFQRAAASGVEALLVGEEPIVFGQRQRLAELARSSKLPIVYDRRELLEAGGLLSYGVSVPEIYRRSAVFVDRILRGANVAELPVELPFEFELAINVRTARELGLTLPTELMARTSTLVDPDSRLP